MEKGELVYFVKIIFIVACFFSLNSIANVDDLFIQSLKTSKNVEVIKLGEEKLLSQLKNLRSGLFPTLDLVNTHQYGNNTDIDEPNDIDSQVALNLNQKLFQGGSEFAISDYSKVVPKKAREQKKLELSEYYATFTTYYFLYSSASEENDKINILLQNLEKRVSLVRARARIGKDRKADLFALESQLFRLRAEYETSKGALEEARTNFLNFSGLKKINNGLSKIDPLKLHLSENKDLLEIPSIKNLEYQKELSELEVKIEESSHYPQVDLGLNYYLDKSSYEENEWEVSLNIRFNIFDFGKRSSAVDTQRVNHQVNRAKYDYSVQNSKRTWSNFLTRFNAKKEELRSYEEALKKIRSSYDEQLKDVAKGLVTQIDVIRSLDDVVSLEKLYIKSSLEVKSLYYQAKAYLGNIPQA